MQEHDGRGVGTDALVDQPEGELLACCYPGLASNSIFVRAPVVARLPMVNEFGHVVRGNPSGPSRRGCDRRLAIAVESNAKVVEGFVGDWRRTSRASSFSFCCAVVRTVLVFRALSP